MDMTSYLPLVSGRELGKWPLPLGSYSWDVGFISYFTEPLFICTKVPWCTPIQSSWQRGSLSASLERLNYAAPVSVIDCLPLIFEVEDRVAVSEFLRRYPFLMNLLLEARSNLEEHFGLGQPVHLRVVTEPDALGHEELFVIVKTTLPPEEAMGYLESVDNEWWLAASQRARCKLNIAVEYA